MERELGQQSPLPPIVPVLSRLERVERLLNYMEGRRSPLEMGSVGIEKEEVEKQSKSLSSALEEVHFKGTLMERVAMLEIRVLQLSMEMEEESMSRSSSSTAPPSDDNNKPSLPPKEKPNHQENKVGAPNSQDYRKTKRNKKGGVKWLGWFPIGC
eukprot:TRINITY_DN24156_c0_g1_i1.p1 TRINITY_DN24156_c0_g1~~TRINITY_DN24156_c0_g1_i1.p1  ORF type:complete len:155 (-),score=36.42 TRINITY_DN24156_c0_g1_i1:252-716(-)